MDKDALARSNDRMRVPRIGRRVALALVAAAPALLVGHVAVLAQQRSQTNALSLPHPARDGLADIGGVKLWYSDTGGSGEAVVLLHAATANAFGWIYQQSTLAKAGYRVITYSRRGRYPSEIGPSEPRGSAAGDLKLLLDMLRIGRVHVVGVAAGGIYATDFALSFPDRIASLVIAGSIVAVGDPEYMKRSGALRPSGFNELPSDFKELGPQ